MLVPLNWIPFNRTEFSWRGFFSPALEMKTSAWRGKAAPPCGAHWMLHVYCFLSNYLLPESHLPGCFCVCSCRRHWSPAWTWTLWGFSLLRCLSCLQPQDHVESLQFLRPTTLYWWALASRISLLYCGNYILWLLRVGSYRAGQYG